MIFSEDQLTLQRKARAFSRDRLLPGYIERDRQAGFDRALLREMGELGFLSRDIQGVDTGIVIEELAYGDFNMAGVAVVQSLCATVIGRSASETVKNRWLECITRGQALLSIAVTEQSAGSDAMAIRMEATRTSGGYLLNGEKWSINLAETADAHLVFAHLKDEAGGASQGISAFLVPAGTAGLSATRYDNLGSRLGGRGTVAFQNVAVPRDHLIGGEGKGFTEVMRGFDFTRALIALQCIGAATASLDETWAHTRSRHAFGGPIARFQGVTLPLAEAEAQLAAGRQLAYHALQLRDLGREHTVEAAMVKSIAPRAAFNAIHNCILTFGHLACNMGSPHQQRMRDVMGLEVGEGTENIMKMIVARQRTGRIAAFR